MLFSARPINLDSALQILDFEAANAAAGDNNKIPYSYWENLDESDLAVDLSACWIRSRHRDEFWIHSDLIQELRKLAANKNNACETLLTDMKHTLFMENKALTYENIDSDAFVIKYKAAVGEALDKLEVFLQENAKFQGKIDQFGTRLISRAKNIQTSAAALRTVDLLGAECNIEPFDVGIFAANWLQVNVVDQYGTQQSSATGRKYAAAALMDERCKVTMNDDELKTSAFRAHTDTIDFLDEQKLSKISLNDEALTAHLAGVNFEEKLRIHHMMESPDTKEYLLFSLGDDVQFENLDPPQAIHLAQSMIGTGIADQSLSTEAQIYEAIETAKRTLRKRKIDVVITPSTCQMALRFVVNEARHHQDKHSRTNTS